LGALFLASRTANAQPADSLLLRGKELLSEGVTAGNGSTVARARSLFERATDAGARAALSRYYLGLASYRLVDLVADEDRGADFMEDAQAQLETVLDLRPEWAEADALLSGIYGRKAERGMLSGMRYGPKANQALTRAKERAPNNPRVLLMEGIGLYNTPSMWGGDKAKAVEHLREAITRFEEASPDDPLQPDWGHADAYAWLGIAHADANRTDAARAAFQNALHVRPGYVWVERVLMPELASAD
jgi:tetratricopeptide (TPR) repeat protein